MNKRGISTLYIVIIISVVSMIMASTVSFFALNDLEISSSYIGGEEALYLADGCLENTVINLEKNEDLLMNDYSLSMLGGLCIINIYNEGLYKKINIKANKNNFYKEVELIFDFNKENISRKYN